MSNLKPLCPKCHNIKIVEIDESTAISKLDSYNSQENTYTENCEKNFYECKNCGHIFSAIRSTT